MKKSKKERNPTTNELIAATFKRTENYVKHVLKVGDVNPDMLDRVQEGRMALYVAYSRAISEERKEKQEVPEVAEVNQFEPDTREELAENSTQVEDQEGTTGTDSQPASGVTVANAKGASIPEKQTDQEDQLTVDPTQVTAAVEAVTIAEDNTITFRCPCGSGKTYLINVKTKNDE